jgi:hypothetical protein
VNEYGRKLSGAVCEVFFQDGDVHKTPHLQRGLDLYMHQMLRPIEGHRRDLRRVAKEHGADAPSMMEGLFASQREQLLIEARESLAVLKTLFAKEKPIEVPEHFEIVSIKGNGDCLFEAVSMLDGREAQALRKLAADEVRRAPNEYAWMAPQMLASQIADFIEHPQKWDAPSGNVAPIALARALKCTLVVFSNLYSAPLPINEDAQGERVLHLIYSNGAHYDALLKRS